MGMSCIPFEKARITHPTANQRNERESCRGKSVLVVVPD